MSNLLQPPVNVPSAELTSLHDLLLKFQTRIGLSFNCHAVATVTSFIASNSTNGYARLTAQMNYSTTRLVQQKNGTFINTQVNYPLLVDCPVVVIGGGLAALQVPIFKGDQVLIMFNDRDLSNWWAGAPGGPPASTRTHAYQDAMALVGFVPWPNTQDLANNHMMMANSAGAQLGIETLGALVRIANNTATLGNILSNLITAIEGLTYTPGSFNAPSGGGPVTGVSGGPVSTTALDNVKTAILGLLE